MRASTPLYRGHIHINAFSATLCTVLTVGILAWGAALAVSAFVCRVLESFSLLSLGWGIGHMPVLEAISGVLVLPVCLWLGARLYRRALAAERELEALENEAKPTPFPPPGATGAA